MITLTLHNGSRWAVPVAHITAVRQHARGAVVATSDGGGEAVRETFDEVLALRAAAVAPASPVDREAVAMAARLLRLLADAPDDLWPTVRRMLGVGLGSGIERALRALRALADRLDAS